MPANSVYSLPRGVIQKAGKSYCLTETESCTTALSMPMGSDSSASSFVMGLGASDDEEEEDDAAWRILV